MDILSFLQSQDCFAKENQFETILSFNQQPRCTNKIILTISFHFGVLRQGNEHCCNEIRQPPKARLFHTALLCTGGNLQLLP